MADADLFRQQAVAHAAESSVAAGVVRQPRWAARWIAPVVIALLAAGGWVAAQPYTDSVRVSGVLARPGGEVILRAPVSGRVAELSVTSGAAVARGDRLMVIDDSRYTAASDETANETVLLEAAIAAQEQQLHSQLTQVESVAQLDSRRLNSELHSVAEEASLLGVELKLAARLLAQARDERADAQVLAQKGHLARIDLRALERREAQHEADLMKLRRVHASLTHRSVALRHALDRAQLDASSSAARLRSELALLARERALLPGRRQAVVSPIDGVVRAIRVAPGASVDRQQPLLTIVDRSAPLVAELPVPSQAVTNIFPGQRVRLRYAGFPHQRFGSFAGTVLDVTSAPTAKVSTQPGGVGAESFSLAGTSVYRVRVAPDSPEPLIGGRYRQLPVGMQVDADLLGNRRPLWMWLLEPILALRGKLA